MTTPALTAQSAFAVWRAGSTKLRLADICLVLVALTLPWSTTLNAIATALWVASVLTFVDRDGFRAALRHPVSISAICLFVLAALGTLWAEVSWTERLVGLGRYIKLLAIPFLLFHIHMSGRGFWILGAFLASCTAVLLLSWLQVLMPSLARGPSLIGVPVKNYIVQSQEFTLCAVALTYPLFQLLEGRNYKLGLAIGGLIAAFIANMLFIVSSRTSFVALFALSLLYPLRFLRGRALFAAFLAIVSIVALSWLSSPYLRQRVLEIANHAVAYQSGSRDITSEGQRLEYWRKAIGFFKEAPIVGHGTGSIRSLYVRAAEGKAAIEAEIVNNPHNQTLAVAVQLGFVGIVALWAMWLVHLRMFLAGGFAAWLGLATVIQNIVSSLFNSHLFDSVEGWIYVFGVGISAGIMLKERGNQARATG